MSATRDLIRENGECFVPLMTAETHSVRRLSKSGVSVTLRASGKRTSMFSIPC
jgi:hypothetical protein